MRKKLTKQLWELKNREGEVIGESPKKPTPYRLLQLLLVESWKQTEILKSIKSAIENSASEVYLDDVLKGQDSTNSHLGELVQVAERIANNTNDKE